MAALSLGLPLRAQEAAGAPWVRNEVFTGSEMERYLRVLQVAGEAEWYPWSVRGFSPAEVDRLLPGDSTHPWARRYDLQRDTAGGLQLHWVRPRAEAIVNSTFPYGNNDGPVWAGRGLTTAVSAGFSLRSGPLSLTVAPIALWAQNASFALMPNGWTGPRSFADGANPNTIDLPQRFGDGAVARIDPGQSTLRLDLPVVAVGISTANQAWGPAGEYPLLLGNNAAGFPHLFLGTSAPLNVGIGRVHGRIVWGRLDQSEYSPVQGEEDRRFMSGLVALFSPAGLDGLEIGGARFFHTPWPEDGLELGNFTKPLEGLLKSGLPDTGVGPDGRSDADNQLASVFARWAFPASGFEAYGEYAREDHNYDFRDLVLEPDHDSAYLLGFQRAWERSDSRWFALRGELLNAQITHLAQVRDQYVFYVHSFTRQGHTQQGQLLGSPAVYGGAGALLAGDYYHPGGRWSVSWRREIRSEREVYPAAVPDMDRAGLDVLHTLGAEALFFRGRFDISAGVSGGYNLNRNFGDDAFNLNATLGVRAGI